MTTMTETTTQVYQLYIRATPEQVWEAITTSRVPAQVLLRDERRVDVRARRVDPQPRPRTARGLGRQRPCSIRTRRTSSCIPGTASTTPSSRQEEDSRVTWQIDPADGGLSKLTLDPRPPGGRAQDAAHVAGGWMWILANMKTLLETGEAFPAEE